MSPPQEVLPTTPTLTLCPAFMFLVSLSAWPGVTPLVHLPYQKVGILYVSFTAKSLALQTEPGIQ